MYYLSMLGLKLNHVSKKGHRTQELYILSGKTSCYQLSRNFASQTCSFEAIWAPSQYPKRRLSVRSRKVSKLRDLYLELSDRSEIWQALRQQCCRCACQISKRYDNLKYQSRGFETSRDLTLRRLFGYWDGVLIAFVVQPVMPPFQFV